MVLKFIDTHTHVQFSAYDIDRDEVLRRALEAGVAIINVGTNAETSEAAVRLTEEYPEGVYATVGIHPIHASGSSFHDKQELKTALSESGEIFGFGFYKKLALCEKVIAIGECGLDYAYFVREQRERLQNRASAEAYSEGGPLSDKVEAQKEKQKEVFLRHIELAHEIQKPLMIHCRETPSPSRGRSAFSDLIELLTFNFKLLTPVPGIIHFFSGTKEDAKVLLDLGFYFTFGGVITFVKDYDEVTRYIPADRILSETDAPYVTPAPWRGKRNEPAYVVKVVERLAELKGVSLDKMAEQILKNARIVFPTIST